MGGLCGGSSPGGLGGARPLLSPPRRAFVRLPVLRARVCPKGWSLLAGARLNRGRAVQVHVNGWLPLSTLRGVSVWEETWELGRLLLNECLPGVSAFAFLATHDLSLLPPDTG